MADQPNPVPNDRERIVDLVIDDLRRRDEIGVQEYGTSLQPFNGRDPLVDAHEETLDKAQYLKQALVERADHRAEERELVVAFLRQFAAVIGIDSPSSEGLVGGLALAIELGEHRRSK